jgi:hypothetical protein
MEQRKMEQMLERLLAGQAELMAKAETTLMMAKMEATMRSGQKEMIKAITEAC